MKKLFLVLCFILMAVTVSCAEQCITTDMCILFNNIGDLANVYDAYLHNAEALPFLVNELIASGKVRKLNSGLGISVVAKNGTLYQVMLNGRLYYTMKEALSCR